jgi:hypothetical protein
MLMKLATWKFLSLIIVMVLVLGLGIGILTPGSANAADPIQQWAARYSNGRDCRPTGIQVDGSGNAYVTGYSFNGANNDYTTVKYNASGVQQWARTTDWTKNDVANAIAVDSSGNAYVTGASMGTNFNYETIKYRPDGTTPWSVRYIGGFGADMAKAIAVDGSGNVYVTGISYGGINQECTTVKYDTDGNQQWVARYSDTVDTSGVSISVDSSGNAYVTGTRGTGSSQDWLTVKYNTAGVQQWAKNYNGTGSGADVATAIALDSSGNAYVTGFSYSGTGYNYTTVKYSTAGVQQWVMTYILTGITYDRPTGIAVDGSGNAYITGIVYSGSNEDYATVKYSTSGVQQWATLYNGPDDNDDEAAAIAVDGSGNTYVTGYSESATSRDYATVKYNTSGAQQWVMQYNGPANLNDYADGIALWGSNVYVTGFSNSGTGGDFEYATVMYHQQITPAITSINPASGEQRQTLSVIITGTNMAGARAVSFGDGITVSSFTVNSDTQIMANIVISRTAKMGPRNVVITTIDGTPSNPGTFKVLGQEAVTTTPRGSGSMTATPPAPPVSLSNLVVQGASLSTTTVSPNTPVTVTADIANKSTVNGNKKVTVYVNGEIETTQSVALDSGSASQLTFNVSRSEPGTYKVYVDGTPAGSFTVEAVTTNDTILIVSVAFLTIAFLCGLIMLRRRQNAGH